MEFLVILLSIAVLTLPVYSAVRAYLTNKKLQELNDLVRELRQRVAYLEWQRHTTQKDTTFESGSHTDLKLNLSTMADNVQSEKPVTEKLTLDLTRSSIPEPAPKESGKSQPPPSRPPRQAYAPPTPKKTRLQSDIEMLLGGRVLNRIGALAITFGAIYFFLWAAENGWINEVTRVIIGVLTGAGLIVAGAFLRRKNIAVVAQGLVAAGAATLYISIFASYNWYHLVPHVAAFGAMIAVNVLVLWRAQVHNAFFLAALSGFAAYLTPAILSTDKPSTVGLFTYVALVNLALIGVVAQRRSWLPLLGLSAFASVWWQWVWYFMLPNVGQQRPESVFFAQAFCATFAFVPFILKLRSIDFKGATNLSLWLVLMVALTVFVEATMYGAGLYQSDAQMVLAALVIFVAGWLARQHNGIAGGVFHGAMVLSFVIGSVSLARHEAIETALLNAAWMALFIAASRRFRSIPVQIATVVVYFIQVCVLFVDHTSGLPAEITMVQPFANLRFVAFVALTLLGVYLSLPSRLAAWIAATWRPLRYVPLLILAIAIGIELNHMLANLARRYSFEGTQYYTRIHLEWLGSHVANLAVALILSLIPLLLVRWRVFRHTIVNSAFLVITLVIMLAVASQFDSPASFPLVFNARFGAGMLASACLLLYIRAIGTLPHFRAEPIVLWSTFLLLTFGFVSMEAVNPFEAEIRRVIVREPDMDFSGLRSAAELSLSLTWLVYASVVLVIGFVIRQRIVRYVGMAILGVSVLKVFLYDLRTLETPYRILSFVGLGIVLMIFSFVYAKLRDRIKEESARVDP